MQLGNVALTFVCLLGLCYSMSGIDMYQDITEYCQTGQHRVGSAGALAAAKWFSRRLGHYGFETELLQYQIDQVFQYDDQCQLAIQDMSSNTTIYPECMPVWLFSPQALNPVANLETTTNAADVSRKAFVMQVDDIILTPPAIDTISSAIENGASAIVIVNKVNEMLKANVSLPVALNVHYTNYTPIINSTNPSQQQGQGNTAPPFPTVSPWPIPVVILGSRYANLLTDSSSPSSNFTLVSLSIKGDITQVVDSPIIHAWLPSSNGSTTATTSANKSAFRRAIVVDAGLSSWHESGGERGPGISIALGIARWIASKPSKELQYDYHFIGTTGHEIGGLGISAILDYIPNNIPAIAADNVDVWIHPGSCTVTYEAFDFGGQGSGKLLAQSAYTANGKIGNCVVEPLQAVGFDPKPSNNETKGGVAELISRGYDALGFWGAFPRFHTPDDDASSTGPELLEPVGNAFLTILESLEAGAC